MAGGLTVKPLLVHSRAQQTLAIASRGFLKGRFLFKVHVCYLGVFKINNSYSKSNEIFLSLASLKRYHLTTVSIRRWTECHLPPN